MKEHKNTFDDNPPKFIDMICGNLQGFASNNQVYSFMESSTQHVPYSFTAHKLLTVYSNWIWSMRLGIVNITTIPAQIIIFSNRAVTTDNYVTALLESFDEHIDILVRYWYRYQFWKFCWATVIVIAVKWSRTCMERHTNKQINRSIFQQPIYRLLKRPFWILIPTTMKHVIMLFVSWLYPLNKPPKCLKC